MRSTSDQSVILVGGMRAPTVSGGSGGGNRTEGGAVVFGDVWRLGFAGARVAWQELEGVAQGYNNVLLRRCARLTRALCVRQGFYHT